MQENYQIVTFFCVIICPSELYNISVFLFQAVLILVLQNEIKMFEYDITEFLRYVAYREDLTTNLTKNDIMIFFVRSLLLDYLQF